MTTQPNDEPISRSALTLGRVRVMRTRYLLVMMLLLSAIGGCALVVWMGRLDIVFAAFLGGVSAGGLLFMGSQHFVMSYAIRKVEEAGKSDDYIMAQRFFPVIGSDSSFDMDM